MERVEKPKNKAIQPPIAMRLTDEQIAKYQQIYLDTFGEPVSREDALIQGMALLRLVKTLANPMANRDYKENENDKEISTVNC